MVLGQSIAQELKGFVGRVDDLQQIEIFLGNGSGIDEGLKIDDAVPVLAAIDHHQNLLGQFVGLGERENLEQFVHGAETAGKDHQTFGQVGKPEFPHEEIVKLKVQRRRDIGIGVLLER